MENSTSTHSAGIAKIVRLLETSTSSNQTTLLKVKKEFEKFSCENFQETVGNLSEILASTEFSAIARTAAGLQFKNQISAQSDMMLRMQHNQRWLNLQPEIRERIKQNIIKALGTEETSQSSAAQCVAIIACIEMPLNLWNDVLTILSKMLVSDHSQISCRAAALEAIGYFCQDGPKHIIESYSAALMPCIVYGMQFKDISNRVYLAAITALLNSIENMRPIYIEEASRTFIIDNVCNSVRSLDQRIAIIAMQCLVKIVTVYYEYVEIYMERQIPRATIAAIKSDRSELSLQGLEFWCSICDAEYEQNKQKIYDGGQVCKNYAQNVLGSIVPEILNKLINFDNTVNNDDNWSPQKAASITLMSLSKCCRDQLLPFVIPFIRDNIVSAYCFRREAAVMCLGCIVAGIDPVISKPLIDHAIPMLIYLMADKNPTIRVTTAWTFGRICDNIPSTALDGKNLESLIAAFLNGLRDEVNVAANISWAIVGLTTAAYKAAAYKVAAGNLYDHMPETFALSLYYERILEEVIWATNRSDAAQLQLRTAAYEALMTLIRSAPKDCYASLQQIAEYILAHLQRVLTLDAHVLTHVDRSAFSDLQSLLCASVQSLLRKIDERMVPYLSNLVMYALITILNPNNVRTIGIKEDALSAMSTLIEIMGDNFLQHINTLAPILLSCIKCTTEPETCAAAIAIIGDISRALKCDILYLYDGFIIQLLENLSLMSLDNKIRLVIYSTFGDIALSIGEYFLKYLNAVMQSLCVACQLDLNSRFDNDNIEQTNKLRESILDGYTGILQGLKGTDPLPADCVNALVPYLAHIIGFLKYITWRMLEQNEHCDSLVAVICGLIGDLCNAFGFGVRAPLSDELIYKVLECGRNSRPQRTRSLAAWASNELLKIINI